MTPLGGAVRIGSRLVGAGQPVYVIAELSGNHGQDYDEAVRLVGAAAEAGADAVKLQTYTADTMTLDSDAPWFRVAAGTLWEGRRLHHLYREAATPWEWQPRLKAEAEARGLDLFSTPFDASAVDFLEGIDVPAYKIASFEIVDLALVRRVARTRRPLLLSTGMASCQEIAEAVEAAREAGAIDILLLKCTSAYPATPEEMHLRTIPDMARRFGLPVGLSDHCLDPAVAISAVALGACVVEKHLTLSRAAPGPDQAFSLEPHELAHLVRAVRTAERSLGTVRYQASPREAASRAFRRSLFVVEDVAAGETFTEGNVRAIRPADGLPPKHLPQVLGRRASRDVAAGTPLTWDLLA